METLACATKMFLANIVDSGQQILFLQQFGSIIDQWGMSTYEETMWESEFIHCLVCNLKLKNEGS